MVNHNLDQVLTSTSENLETKSSASKQYRFLGLLGVVITQALLIKSVIFKEIPVTSGWFMAWAHEAQNRVPYKDFYLPFPPGSILFEGYLPNLFGSEFFGQDVVHAVTWLILSASLYLLVIQFTSTGIALLSTCLATTVYFVQPGNIISGYYETMLMFLLLGLALSIYGWRKRRFYVIYFGAFSLSVSGSIKQTTWLLLIVSLIGAIYVTCKNWSNGPVRKASIVYSFGLLTPWIVITGWNLVNSNFSEMWTALLEGGGKNTEGLTFIALFLQSIVSHTTLWPLVAVLVVKLLHQNTFGRERDGSIDFEFLITLLVFFSIPGDILFGTGAINKGQSLVLLLMGCLTALTYVIYKNSSMSNVPNDGLTWFLPVAVALLVISILVGNSLPILEKKRGPLELDLFEWLADAGAQISNSLYYIGLLGLLVCLMPFLLWIVSTKNRNLGNFSSDLVFVGFATLGIQFLNSFAGMPTVETWILVIPFGFVFLFQTLEDRWKNFGRVLILGFTCFWILSLVPVQRAKPYDWLGISGHRLDETRVPVDFPGLERFSLSQVRVTNLELFRTQLEREDLSSHEILVGARNTGMSVLYGFKLLPTSCVVLWWDVCPERLAKQDELLIRSNPPKLVFWTFEPESTVKGNEEAWRNSEASAVRRIQEFLSSEIEQGRYSILLELPEENIGSGIVTRLLKYSS